MRSLLLALQFLTILPVKIGGQVTKKELSASAAFFPAAGAVQGIIAASVGILSGKIFTPEISAALLLLTFIVINGGFHIDGLADTFDALAVKSSGDPDTDREKRLRVMKDSSTGAIGATAIVIAILFKYVFLVYLISSIRPAGLFVLLFLMPVFSKWSMVLAMQLGRSARKDGLGNIFIEDSTPSSFFVSSLFLTSLSAISGGLIFGEYGTPVLTLFLLQCTASFACCLLSAKFCRKKFGGLTGDSLGAAGEISEILFLAVVAVWLQHFI